VSFIGSPAILLVFRENHYWKPSQPTHNCLIKSNPTVASSFLSASALSPQTVLVPEDNAFLSFQKSTGQSFFDASRNYQIPTIQYHILNGNYSTQDFQRQEGITIPTALTDELYNNRTGGDEMRSSSAKTGNTDGQVVFIAPDSASTTLQVRQVASPGAYAQSGLGNQVNLTSVSGVWDGGSFYTVNGYVCLVTREPTHPSISPFPMTTRADRSQDSSHCQKFAQKPYAPEASLPSTHH